MFNRLMIFMVKLKLLNEYPNFSDESFKGKTKAGSDIITTATLLIKLLETEQVGIIAKISFENNDIEQVQQHHQNLYSSCKSCHSI